MVAGRSAPFVPIPPLGSGVADRIAALDRRTRESMRDGRTGLPGCELFFDRLQQATERTRRCGEPFALALARLSGLDSPGNPLDGGAGDALLRAAAQRLRRCVRRSDTLARLAGDGFGVLLPGAADAAAARHVLRSMVDAFARPIGEGAATTLTIKLGASVCPDDGDEVPELLRAAERALDRAALAAGSAFDSTPCAAEAAQGDEPARRLRVAALEGGEAALGVLLAGVPIQRRTVRAGEAVFRAGDPFGSVHVLRCGACKLVGFGADGREQLVSLLLKGDWLGLDGIARGCYSCDAIAVDAGEVWSFRYDALLRGCQRSPALLVLLHVAMSREIGRGRDAWIAQGPLTADAKVARFLHHLAESLTQRGLRAD
ncbi:MAG TPA: diguanylate cyclase, partial [Burkholderiaceae bacterium]